MTEVEDQAAVLQRLEDEALTLWHKLESRKLDLLMLGDTPRGVFVRDEAKLILGQYVEVQRQRLKALRGQAVVGPPTAFPIVPLPTTEFTLEATVTAPVPPAIPTDRPPPSDESGT